MTQAKVDAVLYEGVLNGALLVCNTSFPRGPASSAYHRYHIMA